MSRKNGFLRALVVGGTIVAGFAMNSADAHAEEMSSEPALSSEHAEKQSEAVQEESSTQKMEDAIGVIEGDVIACEGYLETASEAIEKEELTNEQADELTESGKAILEQAEEKNEVVKAEYERILEETQADKEAFDEAAEAVGLTEDAKRCEEASQNEDKIAIIEEAKESLTPKKEEVDKVIAEIDNIEADIKKAKEDMANAEKIMEETGWGFKALDEVQGAQKSYDDEVAQYNTIVHDIEVVTNQVEILKKSIEAHDAELSNYLKEIDEINSLQLKITGEIKKLQDEIDNLEREEDRLQEELKETSDETVINKINNDLTVISAEKQKKNEQRDELELQEKSFPGQIAAIQHRYDNAQNRREATVLELYRAESDVRILNNLKDGSEKEQSRLLEIISHEAEYVEMIGAYIAASDDYEHARTICRYRERDLMSFDVDFYREEEAVLQNFFEAAENYQKSLREETKAKSLIGRSEVALASVTSAYEKMVSAIDDYKETKVDNPTEPEVTEETYVDTYTTNISKKVRDIFTGITTVVEANFTTNVTKIVKTTKDVAAKVTETVISKKVDVIGTGAIKLYNRWGKLITSISGNVDFALDWLGRLLS